MSHVNLGHKAFQVTPSPIPTHIPMVPKRWGRYISFFVTGVAVFIIVIVVVVKETKDAEINQPREISDSVTTSIYKPDSEYYYY